MIILVLAVLFKLLFLFYPSEVLAASREGLLLWFNNVLPGLLPFMVIINMLVMLGFAKVMGGFLRPVMGKIFRLPGCAGVPLIVGLTSGFPMGAKTVADLRRTGELTVKEAQHLVAFCNNAGPIFILGVVGAGLFGSVKIGYILWVGHILAAILLGIFLRAKKREHFAETKTAQAVEAGKNICGPCQVLGVAVKNAMESMVVIGGLIIFFSAVTAALEAVGLPDVGIAGGLATGLIEVTAGVRDVAFDSGLINIGGAAFVLGFSGLSVHIQALHFLEGTGVKFGPYILAKFAHGFIACFVTMGLWIIFNNGFPGR